MNLSARALLLAACAVSAIAAPRFESARLCSMCHSNIPSGANNVAPVALWTGSMKANAARDPYWRAKVREESQFNPFAAAAIENKCLSCHAAAQQYPYRDRQESLRLSALNSLGEEGVTCTVCHQITSDGLGTARSFTAGFTLSGNDEIFGPHADPFRMPMLHHTGYEPTQAKHMMDSALCGSCHTVITPILNDRGETVGEFLEQAPYLEWLASAYPAEGRTCQSCHMPQLGAPAYIAHMPPGRPFPPTSPRVPFGQHSFAGANARGAEMLAEMAPDNKAAFTGSAARASTMLSRALDLKVSASRLENTLELAVIVRNLTGHKLPTAYPSRRLWLHIQAVDRAGRTVFESGAYDSSTGDIRNAKGDQVHRNRISSPDQVLIYEAEHEDSRGNLTPSLIRAARFRKDNRILPRGFQSPPPSIVPVGTADDRDFLPGSDRVVYVLPAAATVVSVEALYQSIKPSHANETARLTNADAQRFRELYSRHRDPIVAAKAELRP